MESTARRMWHLFEPIHAVTYFAPEARAAADAVGLRGFWMGYTAQRIAPVGPVGPAVAEATFSVFHPDRLERALPDAWTYADPADCLRARSDGAVAALRRAVTETHAAVDDDHVEEAADLAGRAAGAVDVAGRTLAAANRALPVPDEPWAALWQATTTLREHRGDGHLAVLVAHGLAPVGAQLLLTATGRAPGEWMRDSRGWPAERWDAERNALHARGLLDAEGAPTAEGTALHARVEEATDAAARGPWDHLGGAATERLAGLLAPLAGAVLDAAIVPVPNPIGVWPPGRGAGQAR